MDPITGVLYNKLGLGTAAEALIRHSHNPADGGRLVPGGKPATTSPSPARPCVLRGDERTAVSRATRASPVPASAGALADGADSSPLGANER